MPLLERNQPPLRGSYEEENVKIISRTEQVYLKTKPWSEKYVKVNQQSLSRAIKSVVMSNFQAVFISLGVTIISLVVILGASHFFVTGFTVTTEKLTVIKDKLDLDRRAKYK